MILRGCFGVDALMIVALTLFTRPQASESKISPQAPLPRRWGDAKTFRRENSQVWPEALGRRDYAGAGRPALNCVIVQCIVDIQQRIPAICLQANSHVKQRVGVDFAVVKLIDKAFVFILHIRFKQA